MVVSAVFCFRRHVYCIGRGLCKQKSKSRENQTIGFIALALVLPMGCSVPHMGFPMEYIVLPMGSHGTPHGVQGASPGIPRGFRLDLPWRVL